MTAKIIALAFFGYAAGAAAAQSYSDNAYALDGGQLLFRETHYLFERDGMRERMVLYRCPDGRAFGRKIVREDGHPQAPDFDMRDARTGYLEGVRQAPGRRVVYVRRGADRAPKSAPLELPPDGVIDAGFDVYVHRHWDALSHGDTLRFSFLVPSKRRFYTFKLSRRESDSNAKVLALRLSLGAWYAFLAPHIDVRYARKSRRLLRFSGMSNVRDLNLKNYDVREEFHELPRDVAQSEVDAARNAPLTPVCASSVAAPG